MSSLLISVLEMKGITTVFLSTTVFGQTISSVMCKIFNSLRSCFYLTGFWNICLISFLYNTWNGGPPACKEAKAVEQHRGGLAKDTDDEHEDSHLIVVVQQTGPMLICKKRKEKVYFRGSHPNSLSLFVGFVHACMFFLIKNLILAPCPS